MKKNGIIAILAEDKKAVDLKITNAFPMIALEPQAWLFTPNEKKLNISGFQHFSIPPDLQIHLTKNKKGQKEYKFFQVPKIEELIKDTKLAHLLFTYISRPVAHRCQLQGEWEGAAIISPLKDELYDPNITRVFIDFFVHIKPDEPLINAPLMMPDMRLAYNRHGCIDGPFLYDELQRRSNIPSNLLSSIRFGYINMPVNKACYIYIPYEIRDYL